MNVSDFELYKDLLKEKSGLVVGQDKSYLLDSRLGPVAKKWGYDSIDAMSVVLRGVPDKALVNDIVEAMTTNETSFFRDSRPFDLFREYTLPYLIEKRGSSRNIKMWCAAASSGQEPYSLNMIMRDTAVLNGWKTDILATDISHEILEQAKAGVYSQFEVQRGLPIQMLMKYFEQEGEKWKIKNEAKQGITYKYFNLLDPMASLGQYDVIFCRNVLIYFDGPTKTDVLGRMTKHLAPDGFLVLGGAETVLGITDKFAPIPDRRGIYALKDGPHFQEKTAADKPAPLASSGLSS